MARKNKKLLSTLRALEDKQEPTISQRELEEQSVPAPLNLTSAASELELPAPEGDSEVDSHGTAPLLTTSLLEEQLSEIATVPVATAESLHLTDLTNPTEPEAAEAPESAEAAVPTEVETPEATSPTATQELLHSPDQAIDQPRDEVLEQAPQALNEVLEQARDEQVPDQAIAESELDATPQLQPTSQASAAFAEPADPVDLDSPPSSPQTTTAPTEPPATPTFAPQTTAPVATSTSELLKRPEAFALILFILLSTFWQALTNLAKPAANAQRSGRLKF